MRGTPRSAEGGCRRQIRNTQDICSSLRRHLARARHRNTRRLADALWIAGAYLHNMADLCILGDYICVAVLTTSPGEDDSEEDEPVEIPLSAVTMHPKGTPAPASSVKAQVFEERVDLSNDMTWRQMIAVGVRRVILARGELDNLLRPRFRPSAWPTHTASLPVSVLPIHRSCSVKILWRPTICTIS